MKNNKINKVLITALILFLTVAFNNDACSSFINKGITVQAANSNVTSVTKNNVRYIKYNGQSYKVIEVDGGNLSGKEI